MANDGREPPAVPGRRDRARDPRGRAAAALWLDNITRDVLDGGTLKGYIEGLFFDIALEDIGRVSTWTPWRPACRLGRKKWQKRGETVTKRFVSALLLDDVVLGGGNAKKLTRLPMGCRMGDDANAFLGGFRIWEKTTR